MLSLEISRSFSLKYCDRRWTLPTSLRSRADEKCWAGSKDS